MEKIKALYQNLSKSEARLLRNFLEVFHTKGENKPLALIKLIEKQPDINAEEASRKLYSDPKSKAFLMMKSRLYERMTEVLAIAIAGAGKENMAISPLMQDSMALRRALLIGVTMRARGLRHLAFDHFAEAYELAAGLGSPELEIDAMLRMRDFSKENLEEFDRRTAEQGRTLDRLRLDLEGVATYQRFFKLHDFRTGGDEDKVGFLENRIPYLENELRQHYSLRADYYLHTLKITLHSLRLHDEQVKETARYLIKLVESNRSLSSPQRQSGPWYQLGMAELRTGHFEPALEGLEKARSIQSRGSYPYCVTSVMNLYPLLYLRKWEEADARFAELDILRTGQSVAHRHDMWALAEYLRACLQFFRGEYHPAWLTLQGITELNADKEGWNTGLRIFEIILLIEKEAYDVATGKLENLRKHLSRHSDDERPKLIYRLLNRLEKNSFRFEPFRKEKALLDQLQNEHIRRPLGHEVVSVDEWYRMRRGLQPGVHSPLSASS